MTSGVLRRGRSAPAAVAALTLLALAACGAAPATPEPETSPPATPAPTATPEPVASAPRPLSGAGGACLLLDTATIAEHLGAHLDVAAASSTADTHICVVRGERDELPELVLAVSPTTVDVPTFVADVTPGGATAVSELGKAAYQGPELEVGWLSGDDRLLVLSLTPADGSGTAELAEGLLALARTVDRLRS